MSRSRSAIGALRYRASQLARTEPTVALAWALCGTFAAAPIPAGWLDLALQATGLPSQEAHQGLVRFENHNLVTREEHLRRARQIEDHGLGGSGMRLAMTLNNLAAVLCDLRDEAEREEAAALALAAAEIAAAEGGGSEAAARIRRNAEQLADAAGLKDAARLQAVVRPAAPELLVRQSMIGMPASTKAQPARPVMSPPAPPPPASPAMMPRALPQPMDRPSAQPPPGLRPPAPDGGLPYEETECPSPHVPRAARPR